MGAESPPPLPTPHPPSQKIEPSHIAKSDDEKFEGLEETLNH